MTVLEAIQKSSDFLGKKSVDSPRLQTELLLSHLLKMPRMKLYLNFDRVLTAAETDSLRELVKRRGQREPLQHIVGSTWFCGHEIVVNRQVLIPRPETELLAEAGWKWLGELKAGNRNENITISRTDPFEGSAPAVLDLCTGSGCIAIAIAAKFPEAKVLATDISPEALALARENAVRNKVAERIEFILSDAFAGIAGRKFDLMASNPPYIASAEIATLEPEVRDFDPRLALDGGADGLDFYRRLAREAKPFLKADGKLMLEFGDGQAPELKKVFEGENWVVEAVQEDYSQRARILIARK